MNRAVLLFLLASFTPGDAAADDMLPPQIVHEPCDTYRKGRAFVVEALFYDDSPIFDPKVVYRTRKAKEWRSASFEKTADGSVFTATIKARELKGTLEYFIETFDENGNGPARYGSPEAPVRVFPADNPSRCFQTGRPAPAMVTSAGSSEAAAADGVGKKKKRKKGRAASESDPTSSTAEPAGGGAAAAAAMPQSNWDGAFREPAPPPPLGRCELEDPPLYCSALLWTLVGVGVAAVTTGGVVGWCFAAGPCESAGGGTDPLVPDRVTVEVGATDLNGVYGLSF